MNDADRFTLPNGPYRTPRCRLGGKLFCEACGWVTVKRLSAGPIVWPQTIVERSREVALGRHPVVDGNHAEAPEAGHHDRFWKSCLARTEHVAAAMQVNEHAMTILGRDLIGRDNKGAHAINVRFLNLDFHALDQAGEVL